MSANGTGVLQDRVAIVTGAARGLGRAVAEAYDAEGAVVVVSDIDTVAAEKVAAGLRRGEAAGCDVRDEDQVAALVSGVVSRRGRLDIAVANAGVGAVAPIAEMSLAEWRRITSVNLDGVFLTVRHCANAMAAGGGGAIVTMASITALAGAPFLANYAAAKAAVLNLTRTAAVEYRDAGVRVNAMCPAFIDTELVRDNAPALDEALGGQLGPLLEQKQGRMGEPADVTPLAVFLASDRSRFSTGSAFVIDNGFTATLI